MSDPSLSETPRRRRTTARRAVLLSATLLAVVTAGGAPAAAEYDKPGSCREVSIPVAVTEGGPADNTVAATLCTPRTWADGPRQADVLVAGATYNREYWDSSFDPETYSYVDDTLAAGRASFNFDRLGTGAGTRPPSGELTVSSDAFVLHQLIGWVHDQGYTEVNAIGHSLGSATLTHEASRWHDLERVILTGVIHLPGVGLNSSSFFTSLYPAPLDPIAQGHRRDSGYLTTLPGRRGAAFYNPRTADPAVIAHDERTKDVTTVGEVAESMTTLLSPAPVNVSRAITARVLVVMGAEDDIFCNFTVSCRDAGAIAANEAPYYSGAADFDALIAPGVAHNLTLHPSAPQTFAAMNHWITTGEV
ncbi:alpha/beta hydrolase [Nocardia jinanensis]|uniref:Alpha/beta hydrolase n=1 Tax=Nocardia jinanensis TaxID=382504 RepID=A0A917R6L1_9NOCA|nr:alpha/beta hydrolase [Nocardia jinanensis]GGK91841.1 alpha/beta hydrolase [Nocardia jinanensis]